MSSDSVIIIDAGGRTFKTSTTTLEASGGYFEALLGETGRKLRGRKRARAAPEVTGSPESVTADIATYQAALQDLAEVMWLMEHVVPQTVTSDILRIRADNEYARAHLICGIVCLSFDDPPHPPHAQLVEARAEIQRLLVDYGGVVAQPTLAVHMAHRAPAGAVPAGSGQASSSSAPPPVARPPSPPTCSAQSASDLRTFSSK